MNEKNLENLINNKPLLPPLSNDNEMKEFSVKKNRDRMDKFPSRLPTFNMMPFPIDEHKHIGNYENKHNLYLTLALAFNTAMERIENLEKQVSKLTRQG